MKKMRTLKLMEGPVVEHFHTFIQLLDLGHSFYLFRGKAYHPSWIKNMSLGVLRYQVTSGQARLAVKNPKFKEKK